MRAGLSLRARSSPRAFPRLRSGVRTPRQSVPAGRTSERVHPSRSGVPVVDRIHQQRRAHAGRRRGQPWRPWWVVESSCSGWCL